MPLIVQLIVFLILTQNISTAASFDCNRASSVQEKLICQDPKLSDQDSELSGLYSLALSISNKDKGLKKKQLNWLKNERSKCSDIQSLSSLYDRRIKYFHDLLNKDTQPITVAIQGEVAHPPSNSRYSKLSGSGDSFSIAISPKGKDLEGKISGVYDGGRRVWGEDKEVKLKGKFIGNIAIVDFDGGFREEGWGKAMIVLQDNKLYWHVFQDVPVENYVPTHEIVPAATRSSASVNIAVKPDKVMEIIFGGKRTDVDLSKASAAGELKSQLVFSNFKKNHLYLLVDVFGPTKIPGGSGFCGAGEEYNLVWMEFDDQLKPLKMESALYESCRESVELAPPYDDYNKPRYEIQNDSISLKYISASTNLKYFLSYDNNKPESGFTIKTSPL